MTRFRKLAIRLLVEPFLFSSEQQEAENLGYDITKALHTRLMYYDLKKLISNEN